jgi:hypothetical protein
MTIRLNPDPTFPADVQIHVPGREEPAVAKFTFRTMDAARFHSLLIVMGFGSKGRWRRLVAYFRLAWRLRRLPSMVDLLGELIHSWDGFDLPYSRDALKKLLMTFPGVGSSITSAYLENREQARIKN